MPSKPVNTPVTPDTVGAPPAPPPGLDPDEYMTPTGPDMPGDIPGEPFTPDDFITPGDNPDPPFTPPPGQSPPDNPFPPFPGPQPPSQFPPAAALPPIPDSFLPLTPVQPDTPVVPTLVVPLHIPDEQMISLEKRPLRYPVSARPSTKARPTRPVQTPASSSHRATLWGVMIDSSFRRRPPKHRNLRRRNRKMMNFRKKRTPVIPMLSHQDTIYRSQTTMNSQCHLNLRKQ